MQKSYTFMQNDVEGYYDDDDEHNCICDEVSNFSNFFFFQNHVKETDVAYCRMVAIQIRLFYHTGT